MDLSTRYLGLKLKNPIVAAASPLSKSLDGIRQLEDAGASAVVMFSLFEEQVALESVTPGHYQPHGAQGYNEALTYFPDPSAYRIGPDEYLGLIESAKRATDIPVIASLNGVSSGGWTRYASLMEKAGADGIELNIYNIPTDPNTTGVQFEQVYLDALRDVRSAVDFPLAVKLSPYFSSTANMARRLSDAGARALVLFNRFYQPDFDLERLDVTPHVTLSRSEDLRLPLHWVSILFHRVPVDFAITTGVHTASDVLKCIMAGAKITQMASELLQHGPHRIREILEDIPLWMDQHEYESIAQIQGNMSQLHLANPTAYERANYTKELQSVQPDASGQFIMPVEG